MTDILQTILVALAGAWIIYSMIKLLWIDQRPKPWSKLSSQEKALIAKTVERQRAVDKFLSSMQAADRGDYDLAVNLAGETRHILRQIAKDNTRAKPQESGDTRQTPVES